jgi:hypothetical protein
MYRKLALESENGLLSAALLEGGSLIVSGDFCFMSVDLHFVGREIGKEEVGV